MSEIKWDEVVTYGCILAGRVREYAAPELLALIKFDRCAQCGEEVAYMEDNRQESAQIAEGFGRPLVIVCQPCALQIAAELEEAGDPMMFKRVGTEEQLREMVSVQRQYEARRN